MVAPANSLEKAGGQYILRAYEEGNWTGQQVTALVLRNTDYALPGERELIDDDQRFAELPLQQRAAISGPLFGYTPAEIADGLHCPPSLVDTQRTQARKAFGGMPYMQLLRHLIETEQLYIPSKPKPELVDMLQPRSLAIYDLYSRGMPDAVTKDFLGYRRRPLEFRGKLSDDLRARGYELRTRYDTLGVLYSIGAFEHMAYDDQLTSLDDLGPRAAAQVLGQVAA